MAALEAENHHLKQQNAELKVDKKARKKAKKDPQKSLINDAIKMEVWRTVKFVSGEEQLSMASRKVLKYLSPEGYNLTSVVPEDVAHVAEWVEEHRDTVSSVLNGHRSYVVGRIKEICIEFLDQNPEVPLPSAQDIEGCVARKTGLNKALFVFWWDKIVPRGAGNVIHWTPKTRHYQKMSSSTVGGKADAGLEIPPSTEAFAAVAYISNREKWMKMHELKRENPGKALNIVKNATKVKNKEDRVLDVFTDEHPELLPTWTDSNVGQAKFGGWKREGMDEFKRLRILCKEARAKPANLSMETKTLKDIRATNKITELTWLEQRKKMGYGAKQPTVAAREEVADLFDSDEE